MKIAIFLPNWIGDVVMATPTLRAVRERFPDAEITAVLRPYVAEVLAGLDLVDRQIHHSPANTWRDKLNTRFARGLREESFDVVLLLTNSLRTAFVAWLSGAKRRVGFDRDARGWLLTDRITPKPKRQSHPIIVEYYRLAEHLGCKPFMAEELGEKMELATTDRNEEQLEQFWAQHDSRLCRDGVVCLNPGGAFGSAKHWPADSFAALARQIVDELKKSVLVLCGPSERKIARAIVERAARDRVVSFADHDLSVGLTKAAVKHAELLVTTDSGPRHFAPPFGVPVVTLFGPTHIEWSETFYAKARHLQLDVDCGPCQQRVCPLGHHRCMRDLTADEVLHAVVSLLDQQEGSAWAA